MLCGPSLYKSSSLCTYSEVMFTQGLELLRKKMCLYNKNWQESTHKTFFSVHSLYAILKKIRKSNQPSLFLVHPKFYSLEACEHGSIFRTINQNALESQIISAWAILKMIFFFSLGTSLYKIELEWGT